MSVISGYFDLGLVAFGGKIIAFSFQLWSMAVSRTGQITNSSNCPFKKHAVLDNLFAIKS